MLSICISHLSKYSSYQFLIASPFNHLQHQRYLSHKTKIPYQHPSHHNLHAYRTKPTPNPRYLPKSPKAPNSTQLDSSYHTFPPPASLGHANLPIPSLPRLTTKTLISPPKLNRSGAEAATLYVLYHACITGISRELYDALEYEQCKEDHEVTEEEGEEETFD